MALRTAGQLKQHRTPTGRAHHGESTTRSGRPRHSDSRVLLPARTPVGAAVFFALYGIPHCASAQATAGGGLRVERAPEITVTANRREQKLESIPYSFSAVSAEEIAATGITDLASLANEVPGLSYYDFGARQSGATVPIIRGLNASDMAVQGRAFRTFEQSPGRHLYRQFSGRRLLSAGRHSTHRSLARSARYVVRSRCVRWGASDHSECARARRVRGSPRGEHRERRRRQPAELHHERHGQLAVRGHSGVSSRGQIRL